MAMVSHRVSTVYGFWYSNSGLCCGWILMNYNLYEKIWQYKCVHDKAYFNVLFGSEYLVNRYHIWKWQFFRCCKYITGLCDTAQYGIFYWKITKKNQAHEELWYT